ncbi:MAG: DNA methyltransferase [Rhodospirillales bacterium]|nr:DNA methyltransferase [Rhodospirillales bacterium]
MGLGAVDLIYLDPPFKSDRDYNAIYKDETGRPLPDQIEAFCDTWTLDEDRERSIRNMPVLMRESGIDDSVVEFWKLWMNALRRTNPGLLAYLSYMVERLLPMKAILKPTGSIYLHCDPTASHYIKVMMDGIFGPRNFRSEIVWKRTSAHSDAKGFGQVCDYILYYVASGPHTWNPITVRHDPQYVAANYRHEDERGRYRHHEIIRTASMGERPNLAYEYRGYTPRWGWRMVREKLQELDAQGLLIWSSKGRPYRKTYLADGQAPTNLWADIPGALGQERIGFNTQKPLALLERILEASSNPGDVVLDPFCGCATTLEAAHRLGRKWIGIDIAIHAIKRVAQVRLQDRLQLVEGRDFVVGGIPRDLEGASALWTRDKYHFQKWAVEQVDGFVTTRRTGDGGIDGRLYFGLSSQRDLASMAIEVKGGRNVNIGTVRELRGVLERDEAAMAGLIVLHPVEGRKATNFKREMAQAGYLTEYGTEYPRMQMLSVPEMLEGRRFNTPSVVGRRETPQQSLPYGD